MQNTQLPHNYFLYPKWPAPQHIRAAVTLVPSGLDLSIHNPAQAAHSAQLRQLLQLPAEPLWLQQTHDINVALANAEAAVGTRPIADACIARRDEEALLCAILTADCVPILLTDLAGNQVAAIHAGWRGQVAGVIEATVAAMAVNPAQLLAWLGPAIGPAVYEVGEDVYAQVLGGAANLPADLFFQPHGAGKWLFNITALAKFKLQGVGLAANNIYASNLCTYSDPSLFYSYRRDKTCRRHASIIWFAQ